ncbi:CGNR zinc finger domain-containing protein [Paraburkholderia rhizosphaerae]|uniref:Putative RNA-binding Zn ribbon-like protein n=1 Tax=Paraburkholderia rhizosphaerae TaxID=480658 RepID=A0A4R8LV47_9BURK|nr:ABATE domain-containing protein [Paraburkholderia rhizosphaerae]TDY51438.1 putative RNA-binding Zn ribbon-like protein [Paraburkholderia rhizosphaerae]
MSVQFLTLSDHSVLDFINTAATDDTRSYEHLATDTQVVEWMRTHQFAGAAVAPLFDEGKLAHAARTLREAIRNAMFQKKAGRRVNIEPLNAFLNLGQYRVTLVRHANGQLRIAHEYDCATPEQFLSQIANASAELLATGDFNLIRKCASDACSLWFLDRTKAHRRRWCSMARCGNRLKVANYRARRKA